jgi:ABC-type hemin transport system substrate-binding protein
MASEYRIVLLDEFDWNYQNITKQDAIEIIKSLDFEIEAQAPYMLVIGCSRTPPATAISMLWQAGLRFDAVYEQKDNDTLLTRIDSPLRL